MPAIPLSLVWARALADSLGAPRPTPKRRGSPSAPQPPPPPRQQTPTAATPPPPRPLQATLPPPPPGFRYIREVPGDAYAPPPVSFDELRRGVQAIARGEGRGIPHLTFENDVAGGPSRYLPVTNATADMVERGFLESGATTANINSTYRVVPDARRSLHDNSQAVDINRVNGVRVSEMGDSPEAIAFQDAFLRQPEIYENFGPGYQVKVQSPGSAPTPVNSPKIRDSHQNHFHFSTKVRR